MQSVKKDGTLGPVEEFTMENVKKAAQDPDVDHIDVFEGTHENITHRQSLVGKKFSIKKKYQKTGSIKKKSKIDLTLNIYITDKQKDKINKRPEFPADRK